jgi:hypothetical protein
MVQSSVELTREHGVTALSSVIAGGDPIKVALHNHGNRPVQFAIGDCVAILVYHSASKGVCVDVVSGNSGSSDYALA